LGGFLPNGREANPNKPNQVNVLFVNEINVKPGKQTQTAYPPYYHMVKENFRAFSDEFGGRHLRPITKTGLILRPITKTDLMPRQSPTRTEAFPAANPTADSQCREVRPSSDGPDGQGRWWLNRLKHGRYARRLPEKQQAAAYHPAVALHGGVRTEAVTTFEADQLPDVKRAKRVTAQAWAKAWKSGISGPEPQSSLFSVVLQASILLQHEIVLGRGLVTNANFRLVFQEAVAKIEVR